MVLLFFILAPSILALSLFLASSREHNSTVLGASTVRQQPFAYAALPTNDIVFEGSATMTDNRPIILTSFFSSYNSPLKPYATYIVNQADEKGIDWRLLPSIAMQETTLCKKTLPDAKYNCWGYGIWGKKVTSFSSYEEAITTISTYFAKKKEKGVASLDAIGKIYNPSDTSHWKENVAFVMDQL